MMSLPNEGISLKKNQKQNTKLHNNLVVPSNNAIIDDLQRKISLAKGQKKVDLLVKNASIVNVFSGEIH